MMAIYDFVDRKLHNIYLLMTLGNVLHRAAMQYKQLGNSSLNVSIVCLGTMTWCDC